MCTLILSTEQTLNKKKSRSGKIKKSYKKYPSKQQSRKQPKIERTHSEVKQKFPEPIIYDPDANQKSMVSELDDVDIIDNRKIATIGMKITKYYLDLHKDMIDTYNSVFFETLQNIFNLSWNNLTTHPASINYPIDIKDKIYSSLANNVIDQKFQLVNNIINSNLGTFMKSIELSHKFYKDLIDSYIDCIKKS